MNIIGIDIGGTKITGVVTDGKKVLRDLTIVTPKNLFEFERNLIKLADFLSVGVKIGGIGIGIAGLVNAKRGIVRRSPNIKFIHDLTLVKFFKLNGFKTVKVDNDANCFTRAEMLLGQGRSFRNFLALTLGTGIGGGIVIDRKIYRGQNNAGAELGHIMFDGSFLEKKFQKARDQKNDRELGIMFGQAFAGLVNVFAPQAIILGGGVVTDRSRHFLRIAQKVMKKFVFDRKVPTKILISKLKNAGALGAALMLK